VYAVERLLDDWMTGKSGNRFPAKSLSTQDLWT
jgi:hypothetical protein